MKIDNNGKNRTWQAVKILAFLTLLSFILSTILSIMVGGDFENLDGNVAIIKINGPIVAGEGNSLFGDVSSSDEIIKLLRRANKSNKIDAIVIEINSPGGSAVASEEIATELMNFGKPSVAWIREIGTSGAYWIASSTDHIIANPMSITGSIGVIASYLGFSGFIYDHNITYERLVSGNLKDMGSPFKELTSEERWEFQKSLDSIHEYFIDEVALNRELDRNEVKKIASGQFFIGSEAKTLGLIDELGGSGTVKKYVENKIGKDVKFIDYKTDDGFLSSFSRVMNNNAFHIGMGVGSSMFPSNSGIVTIKT
jgi:protease IV